MARIQRANVLLDVKDSEVDYYIGLGYNLLDDNGNVAKAAVPNDLGTLQHCYRQHIAKISELETKVKQLESKLAEAEKPAPKKEKAAKDKLLKK